MADQGVQVLVEIGHRAWYRKKATPEKTHDWILYVRGSDGNDISHFVEKIVFNLHQSFNPPRRVLKSPPYELRESGYGEFMPIIDIYFKNKGEKGAQRKVTIQYYLNLNREDSPPIDNIRPEKLKFFSPAEEFLEKVLRAGGVILGSDGCPIPQSKPIPRPSVVDIQPQNISSSQSFHESRNHDASDFLVDVDSAAKSASQLAKKRKRSTEANPMSNDSNSSNESNASRRSSSKSDPLEKDSDARSGTKQKMHVALFELTDDDSLKKKKKAAPEKSEQSSKSRSVEQKAAKVVESTEDNAKQHRSGKDERHKHSSGKSHHRRDADGSGGRRDHRSGEKDGHGGGGGGHSKPKSEDRNSRSSSRTPSKVKSLESTSGTSRVHGSSSSSHGLSSTHHRSSSSSSSHHHSNSKSSKVDGGSSRHSGSQSQKGESSSSNHHRASSTSSSKHRLSSTEQNALQRKTSEIQIRLSPIDIHDRSASSSSTRKLEMPSSSGSRVGPSPDGFSGGKPNDLSPMKKGRRNPAAAASPAGYLPPTFDLSNGSGDPFAASTNRSIRPKYDKLLDDMKSDDEEEDGEIRSPVATEPPELPWKPAGSDRKDEKSKETTSSFDPHKKSRTSSSSATSRLEKPERFPFGTTEKPSPTKAKSEWSSSVSSEKTSPDDSSFSGSQVKAKKSHAKENVADGESRSSKKSVSKSGGNQKDFSSVSQRTASSTKQKSLLPPTDFSSFAVKSESDEKSDGQKFNFKVEPQWDNSYEAISKAEEDMKKETTTEDLFVKTESSFYDEKKCVVKSESLKKGATTTTMYSDRAANGELLISLVELKEKIDRVTSAILLNRIVDVIESAGKLKSDDDALEFDFCQLDSETMIRVKQILETVSD